MSKPVRAVRCVCGAPGTVTLRRMPSRLQSARARAHFEVFGGVCEACGRGMDLLVERKPANEVPRAG